MIPHARSLELAGDRTRDQEAGPGATLARPVPGRTQAGYRIETCVPIPSSASGLVWRGDAQAWPELLNGIASLLNPLHDEIFRRFPLSYYWSTYQSEWASDIVFRRAEQLRRLYPLLLHHAMTTFRSPDVLRFLGKKPTAEGDVNGNVAAEVTSDLKRRQEGVRIKHRYNGNSVKLHDKAYTPQGAVLRAELTMDEPEDFKVYRRPEGDPDAPLAWLRMRKGIADLHRRAEVSPRRQQPIPERTGRCG